MIAVARSSFRRHGRAREPRPPAPGRTWHAHRRVRRPGHIPQPPGFVTAGVVVHLKQTGRITEQFGGRLGRPVLRQPLVRRRRLTEMLDAGVRRPVTLVCAGPGWGKSTLVASWAEARVR